MTSTKIYECLNPEACQGGYEPGNMNPVSCAKGYTGILCHDCVKETGKGGERYVRIG